MSPTPSPDLFPQHRHVVDPVVFQVESDGGSDAVRMAGDGLAYRFGPRPLGVRKVTHGHKAATPADQKRLDALFAEVEKRTAKCAFHLNDKKGSFNAHIEWSRRLDRVWLHIARGTLAGRWDV